MPAVDSAAARTFTVRASSTNATAPSTIPKVSACCGCTRPLGIGRFLVRVINASMSRSRYMLMAAEDADASAPPSMVQKIRTGDGQPPTAIIIAVSVVNSSSDMTFGLVSAK